jgi:hypothetical protein
VVGGDERPHLGARVVTGPHADPRDALGDRSHETVADATDRDDHGDRHAPLPRGAVARRDRGVCRHLDVRVGQHDHVVLGTAECLHPLAVAGADFVDVAGDRGGPDERHG